MSDTNRQSATDAGAARIVVWTDAGASGEAAERLRAGVESAGYRLVFAAEQPAGLAEADIAFGQPDPGGVIASDRLHWVHLTSAGYTRYDRPDLRTAMVARGALLTNSSHVYDEPCAEHVLAMLLAFARQFPRCLQDQITDRGWHTGERRAASFLLTGGQTAVLLGYGAIGRRLAQLLAPFGMRLIAVRRAPTGDEAGDGVEAVTEADLSRVLPLADHVIDLLPESASTRGYMDGSRFDLLKPGALFYNIGRGATVDQEALRAALRSGRVGAAYLDVTTPEPLPPDHALWTTPNCYITPHSAGGHGGEELRLVAHFLSNLSAFREGRPLADRLW